MRDDGSTPKPRKNRLKQLGTWVKAHKRASILMAAALLLAGGGAAWALTRPEPAEPVALKQKTPPPPPKPAPTYYSPLTGVKVKDEAAERQPVTAIMIENSPDARPQSGLKNSGVVFEAVAEGGITRFLVLYQQEKPALVGPVRSLRIYYVDWLAPFDASVAHVGGSKAALDEIRNGRYRDIDQFFNPDAYWRSSDRYAPHNVYTSFERLDALNRDKGYTESKFTGFARKDDAAAAAPDATAINVTISGPLYDSSYSYDAASNSYRRSQAGAPHLDREDGQIAPKVVIVMKAPMVISMQDGYRENIQTTGNGPAYVFQDGTVKQGQWHKASRTDQLRFTDAAGAEIALNRGQTWLTVVPNDNRGGVSWQ